MKEDKNIAQLARDAASDISSIAANEMRLATAELKENLSRAAKGVGESLAGAVLLIPACTVGLIAIGLGLGSIEGLADWLAMLIVAVIAGVAGFVMLRAGKGALGDIAPRKTLENLRRDAKILKDVRS
jgi:hypothetical protein